MGFPWGWLGLQVEPDLPFMSLAEATCPYGEVIAVDSKFLGLVPCRLWLGWTGELYAGGLIALVAFSV